MSQKPQTAPSTPVLLEGKHDGIATLVMNRPDRMNALNNELGVAMDEALGRIAADPEARVVVITGAGRALCAGGGLALLGKGRQTRATKELETLLRAGAQNCLEMSTRPHPAT